MDTDTPSPSSVKIEYASPLTVDEFPTHLPRLLHFLLPVLSTPTTRFRSPKGTQRDVLCVARKRKCVASGEFAA